jgi:hypothetical protein
MRTPSRWRSASREELGQEPPDVDSRAWLMKLRHGGGKEVQVWAVEAGSGRRSFGDSGGPIFHEGIVVAINTWTFSARCDGPNFGYRVDSEVAQSFLDSYL